MTRYIAMLAAVALAVANLGCGESHVSGQARGDETDLASSQEAIEGNAPAGGEHRAGDAAPMEDPVEVPAVARDPGEAAATPTGEGLMAASDPMVSDAKESVSDADTGEAVDAADSAGVAPSPFDPSDPYSRFAFAVDVLHAGEADTAVSLLTELLDEFRGDIVTRAKVRTALARARLREAGYQIRAGADATPLLTAAREDVTEAINIHPEASDAWNVRGRVLLMSKRPVEAYQSFRRAISLDPENAMAHNNLGYALILGGGFREAVDHLRDAVEAFGRIGRDVPGFVYNNLGVALERTGQPAEARDAYAEAVARGHLTAGAGLARVEAHLAPGAPGMTTDTAAGVLPRGDDAQSFRRVR